MREYFGARLKELDRETFKAAHGRLYDHYRYAGLPAAFRDPVAYGVLALAAAFPNAPFKQGYFKLAAEGNLPRRFRKIGRRRLRRPRQDQLRKAAALIGGAEWDER